MLYKHVILIGDTQKRCLSFCCNGNNSSKGGRTMTNVSVWMMILWLINCYIVISSLFSKPRPIKFDSEDNDVVAGTAIVTLIMGVVFMVLSVWYLCASATIINHTLFTLFSAALIIVTIIKLPKLIVLTGKIASKQTIEPPEKGLSATRLVKILHLAYFGYYVFTGVSLFDVLLK